MCLAGKYLIFMLILHSIYHNTHTHSIFTCFPPTIASTSVGRRGKPAPLHHQLAGWLSVGLPHKEHHRKGNRNHSHRFMGSNGVDKA